jgi:hypothetical protein
MEYDFKRLGYGFKGYLDCDVDELCHTDVYGVSVYDAESGEHLKDIDFTDIETIGDMTTDELIDWLADNEL